MAVRVEPRRQRRARVLALALYLHKTHLLLPLQAAM